MNTTLLDSSTRNAGRAPSAGLTAAWVSRVRRAGRALWRGLEAHGRARALREFEHLQDRWETIDPLLAKRLRVAAAYLVAEGERRGD